jgi:hypothetical protein
MEAKSLYAITTEFSNTMERIAELDGEVSEETELALTELTEMMVSKTDSIVGWVQSQNDLIGLARERIGELEEFIGKISKRLEKFDGYVDNCMGRMGTNKFEGTFSSVVKRKPSQVVEIFDESLIDVEFIKTPEPKPVVQKLEIGKALKAGQEVPGARLVESKKISIQYKVK